MARELDMNKELLLCTQMYIPEGFFFIHTEKEPTKWIPAQVSSDGSLKESCGETKATSSEILRVYEKYVKKKYVTSDGQLLEKGAYPIYQVTSPVTGNPDCYVIPVQGFGLWDKIAGFIAIEGDGKTVRGISWYEQKETPGLGGTISEKSWQQQFYGKSIFLPDENGKIDMDKAPLGISVVKGKVSDLYGNTPQAAVSVDGISGATLTGNGVTTAYKSSLAPYRPFFENLDKNKAHS